KTTNEQVDYAYNSSDELTGIDIRTGSTTSRIRYTYDAMGRRIAKSIDGAVTSYVYDGRFPIAEYNGATLVAKYFYGPEPGRPLAVARGGQIYYYLTDRAGSVRRIVDANGTVVNRYTYSAYGVPVEAVEG